QLEALHESVSSQAKGGRITFLRSSSNGSHESETMCSSTRKKSRTILPKWHQWHSRRNSRTDPELMSSSKPILGMSRSTYLSERRKGKSFARTRMSSMLQTRSPTRSQGLNFLSYPGLRQVLMRLGGYFPILT